MVSMAEADSVQETARTLARPKSRILACPRLVTKMLAGLMSRWTIPWESGGVESVGDFDADVQENLNIERATHH
jgi:hypothetical protein